MAAAIGAVVPNCPSWGPQFTTNKAGQAQEPGPGPGIIINNWGRISRSSRLNAKAKSKVKRKRSRSSSSNSGGFEIIMVCGAATATATASGPSGSSTGGKQVWIWTENKEVMTAAVQRAGWNTFIFQQQQQQLQLQQEELTLHSSLSSSIAQLFIDDDQGEGGRALFDADHNKVATFLDISSPDQLQNLQQTLNQQPLEETNNVVVVNLLDWQVIPAENIVAAIQRTATHKTVFAVSNTPSQAQLFLEALEHGLGGVVLKTDRVHHILHLKDYLDRRNSQGSVLELTKARVTNIQMVGMGDRVCVDLCSIMAPGEGLLVGSFARGLFLVHSECLESSYISSRPFRVNAGPVHAYAAIPGDKTSYLSELKAGKEVIIVDQNGRQRTAVIGRVKIETRPLVLVEAKRDEDDQTCYSILLQNAETVALISSDGVGHKAIPVTSLKLGDEVLLRMQGGARHTGIEIQEFIVEK